ncbi:glycosyltransferase family 2 protein [candidate division KSB1 bacterium]|nr:glycosyltransferase family 2 protein [candidate division KSB1 bacterium]RQW07078.1 MAG: glycosyltransferase [candidate division KSB1 bacterium]
MASDPIDISIVVPLFNEQDSLFELFAQIKTVMQELELSFEVIFVDDGSTDRSSNIVHSLNAKDPRAKLIQFRKNYGKAAGLAAGFKMATGDVVITMDADLQDDPKEIPHLLDKLNEGYDLVSGWKKVRHDPFIKTQTSKVYNYFTSLFSGIRLHDFNCGLKAYRSQVVKTMSIYGELHRYLPVIAFRNGYRVTEIPVSHRARKYGRSKYGVARFTRGAFDLLTISFLSRYKKRPLHLFGSWGLLSTFAGLVILAILAAQKLLYDAHLSRRPLLFLGLLMVIVGIQFFSIGLLGEMISESRSEVDNYLVKKTVGWD